MASKVTIKRKAQQTADAAEETVQETAETLTETLTRLAQAGLGVLATLQEQASTTFDELVERGESLQIDEKAGKLAADTEKAVEKRTSTIVSRVQEPVRDVTERATKLIQTSEKAVVDAVEKSLRRLNVPTRDDVKRLQRSVEKLAASVNELREEA